MNTATDNILTNLFTTKRSTYIHTYILEFSPSIPRYPERNERRLSVMSCPLILQARDGNRIS